MEVDDDILTVFTIISSQIKELCIAKNSTIDSRYVDLIVDDLGYNKSTGKDISIDKTIQGEKMGVLGNLKWKVLEYDNLRILQIYEPALLT